MGNGTIRSKQEHEAGHAGLGMVIWAVGGRCVEGPQENS